MIKNKPLKLITPPMGWNSYCSFECTPTEKCILESADALVETGLRDAGYVYLNIDDGWMCPERDAEGKLMARPALFPSGMKYVTDYIHAKGLKAGIYLGCGLTTWHGDAGTLGHEIEDAQSIADWGFDYLKYDKHFTEPDPPRDLQAEYIRMALALDKSGRDIIFNMCEHGSSAPWEWASGVGQLWRTGEDVRDSWNIKFDDGVSCLREIVSDNAALYPYSGVGHFNDPDMLVVGMHRQNDWMGPGCTDIEYMSHFALWCMLAAPLLIGCDIRRLTDTAKKILTNSEMIAINQDPLCVQGRIVRSEEGQFEIWVRPLSHVRWAVGMLNLSDAPRELSFTSEDLRLSPNVKASLRDIWTGESLGEFRGNEYAAATAPHEMKMIMFSPIL